MYTGSMSIEDGGGKDPKKETGAVVDIQEFRKRGLEKQLDATVQEMFDIFRTVQEARDGFMHAKMLAEANYQNLVEDLVRRGIAPETEALLRQHVEAFRKAGDETLVSTMEWQERVDKASFDLFSAIEKRNEQ